MTSYKILGSLLAATLVLGGCSTLSKINPFDGSDKKDRELQGEVAEGDERLSILTLNDKLEVGSNLTPADVILPQTYVNADWPQVGGYPDHNPQRTMVSGDLNRIWKRDIGEKSGRKSRVVAPPVVAAGRVFAMDGDNRVTSVDANTGERMWSFDIEVQLDAQTRTENQGLLDRLKNPLFGDGKGEDKEGIGGGVGFADGRLYVTSGLGVVIAVDAMSGEELWRSRTIAPMHSAPTISGGRIFAVSDDNELFAFDARSGDVLWTYQAISETARMLTTPSPAVVDDVVIAPFASGEVIALRAQNGGVLWQDALSSSSRLTPLSSLNDVAAGPVVADGYVFASAQSGVTSAYDLRTGQRIWSQPAGTLSFPLVAGDFIYAVTTDAKVVCMSKTDGTVVWLSELQGFEKEKKRKKRIAWAGPVFAGERLVIVGSNGRMIEMDPQSGAIMRDSKIGEKVFITPVVANETVYLLSDEATLIALR